MSPADGVSWSSTSLDSVDYDPIDHLNAIFSHPITLASVAGTSYALQDYRDALDDEIAEQVNAPSASDAECVRRMQTAKEELSHLFRKIESVRQRALQTEQAITDMTADIKRLDGTKRNLTLSMTALKRLQMLTTAYEQLQGLSKSRQYRECAQLLQAVIQLMAHFKSYRSIDQIATLSRNVADLQRELLEQVCEDFEITFAKSEVSQRRGTLAEGCLVMDALGENARSRLITWYCNTQLREYRQVFRGNDEAGSLDNISRRYSWFKRVLKTYDDEHAAIFPSSWRVNEMLANAFCEGTREDFKAILARSVRKVDGQKLDVNLLLSCLQETLDFEQTLERRFANDSRASSDTISSRDDRPPVIGRAISEAFEPYLSVWVEAQDKHLSSMIPKYRQQPPKPPDEDFSAQSVVPSSVELFHFYRLTLAQCAKLSTGERLLELSKIFAKYLDDYAESILLYYLRDRPGGQPAPLDDVILVLNTADYCHVTCAQLDEKIKSKVDDGFKAKVDLQSQEDAFMGVASAALRALVRMVEQDCEQTWREMRNTPWSKLEGVGDQSPYVAELLKHVRERASEILRLLAKQQYARAFCDKLVELLANTYLANIVQCRPVSETGAEQMLLDIYVLKKGFEELATLTAEAGATPPPGYIKRVNQSMTKLDPLLKTLQVRTNPPEGLVQAYLIHIGDRSDANFRKILELKGIRKQDHAHLVELFQAHRASHDQLAQSSPLLTPLNVQSSNVGQSIGSLGHAAAMSTPSLPGRFDPSTLGSALMSAARDGVDRLGTPTLGGQGANTPTGSTSPPQGGETNAATHLNENLRNIGKFLRRDMGGLGGRFGGSGKVTDDGSR
ncbi:MAG: Vacuolar protein sorting-associated protein 53 [Piccolia ochrophora]|nr:MAG: Vacuolar protein sorting-associated protein 53 [Piccolia ochrophora]